MRMLSLRGLSKPVTPLLCGIGAKQLPPELRLFHAPDAGTGQPSRPAWTIDHGGRVRRFDLPALTETFRTRLSLIGDEPYLLPVDAHDRIAVVDEHLNLPAQWRHPDPRPARSRSWLRAVMPSLGADRAAV